MTEIEQLKQLLKEDWREVTWGANAGFVTVAEVDGDEGRWYRHVEVITRGPSGQHYRWEYEQGLTEYQDSTGPGEYGDPNVTPVRKVTRMVEETVWEVE
ncbi:hypothetical protein ACWCPQ_14380 [Nocardia sp. NPDC001965]